MFKLSDYNDSHIDKVIIVAQRHNTHFQYSPSVHFVESKTHHSKMKLLLLSTISTTTIHAFLPQLPRHSRIRHCSNLKRLALSDDNNKEAERAQSNAVTKVLDEANEALTNVGWSVAPPPLMEEGELTSDDPFVQQIDEGIRNDFGVGLNDLLNPAKVNQ